MIRNKQKLDVGTVSERTPFKTLMKTHFREVLVVTMLGLDRATLLVHSPRGLASVRGA